MPELRSRPASARTAGRSSPSTRRSRTRAGLLLAIAACREAKAIEHACGASLARLAAASRGPRGIDDLLQMTLRVVGFSE